MGFTILWLALIIAFVVIEAATMGFVSMWFAVGSLVSLIVSLFNVQFGIQFLVFVVVSALSLAIFMKPLKNKLSKRVIPTNADSNVGRIAMVIAPAEGSHLARVRIDGVDWSARCTQPLVVGAECRIVSISGATLNVEAVTEINV